MRVEGEDEEEKESTGKKKNWWRGQGKARAAPGNNPARELDTPLPVFGY